MEQKCSKPRHNAPLEPAQFLLKSLDDVDEGKASFWLNVLLCVFLIKIKYVLYICRHRVDIWKRRR